MNPPPWREHPADSMTIANNIATLDATIASSKGSRERFTLDIPRSWHTEIHRDCRHIPIPSYVGNYRGSDDPFLREYGVRFGPFLGSPPELVQDALDAFAKSLETALSRLDGTMPSPTEATPSRINSAIECVARHYADWLKIHPFADGNGRTARILANWILARYWQPIVLPGRPPVDRAGLIAATTPALALSDYRPLTRYLRTRLVQARRTSTLQ